MAVTSAEALEYQPNQSDELRSLQRVISWAFPNKEIRRSREGDIDAIDILIQPVDGKIDPHNQSVSFINTPYVIYYNPTNFDDAVAARDKFVAAFEFGLLLDNDNDIVAKHKRRLPVWEWVEGDPAPLNEDVKAWFRITRHEAKIIEQDEPGRYLAICEINIESFRVQQAMDAPTVGHVVIGDIDVHIPSGDGGDDNETEEP